MDKRTFTELLAPCGSFESLLAALRSGANAVYVGSKRFSARQNAQNFTADELESAVNLCHTYGAKIYQAVNTIVFDHEIRELCGEIELACKIGIDGLIIQDRAAEKIVRELCPDMPIHASTQAVIHTENGVLWAKEHGYSRVVLSRELPAETIGRLSSLGIETEIFVHGALCMSVSGQCYLSAAIGSRSANRGLCAGACRLPFSAVSVNDGKYALSLKDMSLIEYASELAELGVSSLKIEGRMKRPEYVSAATGEFSSAMSGGDFDQELLRSAFSRSGFTDGYYTGKKIGMFGARSKEDVLSASDALPKIREKYKNDCVRFDIDMKFSAKSGSPVSLTASDGSNSVVVLGKIPEKAVKRPCDAKTAAGQLSKLGGTFYRLAGLEINLDDGLMIPLSDINALRRSALEKLDRLRCDSLTKAKPFGTDFSALRVCPHEKAASPEIRISVQSVNQLKDIDINDVSNIIIPLGEAEAYAAEYPMKKAAAALDRFCFDEELMIERLKKAANLGLSAVECHNPAHIRIAKKLKMRALGGFGLNAANSLSIGEYAGDGVEDITASFELKASQINKIVSPVPIGAVVYGRLPLMLTVNCPIKNEVGCASCTRSLTDRTGAKFPVLCHKDSGLYELLNSKVLFLSDKLSDFNIDFVTLYFTVETPSQVKRVLQRYKDRSAPEGDYTRGLYYRGVE